MLSRQLAPARRFQPTIWRVLGPIPEPSENLVESLEALLIHHSSQCKRDTSFGPFSCTALHSRRREVRQNSA